MVWTTIEIIIALTTGNFLWQIFTENEWAKALERSYFQAVACIILLIALT